MKKSAKRLPGRIYVADVVCSLLNHKSYTKSLLTYTVVLTYETRRQSGNEK